MFRNVRLNPSDWAKSPLRNIGPDALITFYFASASRFSLAQSLSAPTAFIGGPPWVPQAQGPSIFASVMQEHDLSFMHAQTYTIAFDEWSFPALLCSPEDPASAGEYAKRRSKSDKQIRVVR